jgi:ADP-heptose:LPS heptosyltransferase
MSRVNTVEPDGRPIAVIVDREGLGDVLLKLPMLRAIARAFPDRPIWWIASNITAVADDLWPYMRGMVSEVRPLTGISTRKDAVAAARELPAFSLVFDTRTRIASIWHARRLLRRRRYFCCTPGYLLSDARPGRFMRPRHIGERALSLARAALGDGADGSGSLACGAAAREAARKLLPEGPTYVGLAVGSREVRKNWPAERFRELAQALIARGYVPVFLLGPQEASVRDQFVFAAPGAIALDMTQMDPQPAIGVLDAAIAVLERLSLVIANDAGLGHLAGAVGRPLVSLFGPTDPRRWAPMGPVKRVVRAQDYGTREMSGIPVTAVVSTAESLLQGL